MAERSGLLGFLARRVAPAVDRRLETPSIRIQRAARSQARLDLGDEAARDALRDELGDLPAGSIEKQLSTWWPRDSFIDDRAYRLLVAIRDDSAVPAIEPGQRELFELEQTLGRLPLPDAFERLAEIDPTLRSLATNPPIRDRKEMTRISHELENSPLELLNGQLARAIVLRHLSQDPKRETYDPTPAFERNESRLHGSMGLANQRPSAHHAASDGPSEDIIVCPDEETAQKVAKQRSLEQPGSMWIYRQESGQWLARRWK